MIDLFKSLTLCAYRYDLGVEQNFSLIFQHNAENISSRGSKYMDQGGSFGGGGGGGGVQACRDIPSLRLRV